MSDVERVDISIEIAYLCDRLGFRKEDVSRIVFSPLEVTVTTFARDEKGRFRVLAGDVVVDETTIKVIT